MNWTTYSITEAQQFGIVAAGSVDTNESDVVEHEDQKRRFKPIQFLTKNGRDDLMTGPGGILSNVKGLVCVHNGC